MCCWHCGAMYPFELQHPKCDKQPLHPYKLILLSTSLWKIGRLPTVSIGTGWETRRPPAAEVPALTQPWHLLGHKRSSCSLWRSQTLENESICGGDKELITSLPEAAWLILVEDRESSITCPCMLGLILLPCFLGTAPNLPLSLSRGFPAGWQHSLNLQHQPEMPQVSALICVPLMK